MNEAEMQSLREGIRSRYEAYRREKPGRYPKIKFNSYPTPYEHLQESFREELVRIGKEDMQEALRHIPSTKVFARMFHEGYLLRDEKLIDTCYLYSWGRTRDALIDHKPEEAISQQTLLLKKPVGQSLPTNSLWVAGSILVLGLAICGVWSWQKATAPASGLVILSPTHQQVVPREMMISGKVANAQTVWVLVRYIKGSRYWVQPPIQVSEDGTWQGIVYIGSTDRGDLGLTSQVRAFVNPVNVLKEGDTLADWPGAELTTPPIEVVREVRPK